MCPTWNIVITSHHPFHSGIPAETQNMNTKFYTSIYNLHSFLDSTLELGNILSFESWTWPPVWNTQTCIVGWHSAQAEANIKPLTTRANWLVLHTEWSTHWVGICPWENTSNTNMVRLTSPCCPGWNTLILQNGHHCKQGQPSSTTGTCNEWYLDGNKGKDCDHITLWPMVAS